MPVYIAVIGSRRIVAFHADSDSGADRRVRDPLLRDDLMTLVTRGLPLWDGMTEIIVREALSDEEADWQASRARAIRQGNIDSGDNTWIAYLVPLSDVTATRRADV
jgi:hypothetical protein